jgi:CCR4-NOT transcription complex subunit 7/8
MSTCSRSFNSALRYGRQMASCHHLHSSCHWVGPIITIHFCQHHAHGNSTSSSALKTTCTPRMLSLYSISLAWTSKKLLSLELVTDRNVTWLSFHSGYDFGYLVKIMFPAQLPENEDNWLDFVRTFFPRIWDIKFLFRHAQRLAQRGVLNQQGAAIINAMGTRSGLQDLADELQCSRVGQSHTAGSDAWLTGLVFWQLRQKLYSGTISDEHNGQIWGINNVGPPASASSQAAAIAGGHSTPSTNGASLYNTGMTPKGYNDGGPSTPQQSTPATHPSMSGGQQQGGQMMPGGAFANFQYGGR